MHVVAVVLRRGRIAGGDDVPAGAAIAQMVERGEHARHRVGIAVGGGHRADEADVLRPRDHRRQHRGRLEVIILRGVLQHVRLVQVGDGRRVGQKQEMQLRLLGDLRDVGVVARAPTSPSASRPRHPDAASRRCSRAVRARRRRGSSCAGVTCGRPPGSYALEFILGEGGSQDHRHHRAPIRMALRP